MPAEPRSAQSIRNLREHGLPFAFKPCQLREPRPGNPNWGCGKEADLLCGTCPQSRCSHHASGVIELHCPNCRDFFCIRCSSCPCGAAAPIPPDRMLLLPSRRLGEALAEVAVPDTNWAEKNLAFGACPNPSSIELLLRMGIELVVSLLEEPEAESEGLADENDLCNNIGIGFRNIPVPDGGVPELNSRLGRMLFQIGGKVLAGTKTFIHCRNGIGRSSMMTACVLVSMGRTPEEACRLVSEARGLPLPPDGDQRDFVSRITSRPS